MSGSNPADNRPSGSDDDASPSFRLSLLGVPIIERWAPAGYEELSWSLQRALKILGFLASSPDQRAPRDEIIEVLWPNADAEVIRRNFHPTVSVLRRTLKPGGRSWGSVIRLKQGVYSLDESCHWEIDTVRFEEEIDNGQQSRQANRLRRAAGYWRAAWSLYRGVFFRGHDDPWVLTHRDRLQWRYLELLGNLGDLLCELTEWTLAEDCYRSLLLEDPLQESVYVSLMGVYAARGRKDLVQRQYERMSNLLRRDLGVEPSTATMAAYNQLLLAN